MAISTISFLLRHCFRNTRIRWSQIICYHLSFLSIPVIRRRIALMSSVLRLSSRMDLFSILVELLKEMRIFVCFSFPLLLQCVLYSFASRMQLWEYLSIVYLNVVFSAQGHSIQSDLERFKHGVLPTSFCYIALLFHLRKGDSDVSSSDQLRMVNLQQTFIGILLKPPIECYNSYINAVMF